MTTAETARTKYIKADNGNTFAYRRLGPSEGVPLVMHIHFRGTMDFWDPLLLNNLAAKRPVIVFDNSGIGKTGGQVPVTIDGWADDMISFVKALGLKQIDLLGFSMGGFAAQMMALDAPQLVRKLIVGGTTASAPLEQAAGIIWPREGVDPKYVTDLVAAQSQQEGEQAIIYGLFPDTDAGRQAGKEYWARVHARTTESTGGEEVNTAPLGAEGAGRQGQALADWSTPSQRNSFGRLGELKMPVLIQNGDDDLIIPSSRSYEFLKLIDNAQLILYPKSGHGYIWQYAEKVAEDINSFLDHSLA